MYGCARIRREWFRFVLVFLFVDTFFESISVLGTFYFGDTFCFKTHDETYKGWIWCILLDCLNRAAAFLGAKISSQFGLIEVYMRG